MAHLIDQVLHPANPTATSRHPATPIHPHATEDTVTHTKTRESSDLVAKNLEQTSAILDDKFASTRKYTTISGIMKAARHQMSESIWDYLWTGTSGETTTDRNSQKFDELLWEVPLFAGLTKPKTETNVLGLDLSFPLFTAPFGQEAVFHPDGHKAVGRAAQSAGVKQMVPVAASFTLEQIAEASDAAAMFQMSFVGKEEHCLQMIERAKAAGYKYIIATYSPIRQWRERLLENRFVSRFSSGHDNFDPSLSNPAPLEELINFTESRWDWARVKAFIPQSPLPIVIKGISSAADATAAIDAGAVGLYVSNYGGRTVDRTLSSIETLPEIRKAAGPDMPIIIDSGIRRGGDIAAALALGANAVAIGRLTGLGLAADGEEGVEAVLDILREEFWMTMGHLGCSTVTELTPQNFRDASAVGL
ncbi:alpha-hydroxy-acid oxidizing protein [Brevibacterium sp. 91QC2O2]|uniref:alpha-hydroxy acid oxidase n=1 Tax=Brevibacterium sp. 91QC2O2 TaxID=2968458 RepID=UPI00211C4681|nr:alpha-hydroxy acid oxidase [Brevibacterium sp. 91QC2O2]MCQ9368744.1 alpha-hydroxy-acid oxidizing protein [Brevibacterium sp. 91QC2O2]